LKIRLLCIFAFALRLGAAVTDEAQSELFAGRYERAARLFAEILKADGGNGEAHAGLVRALLRLHRSGDAIAAGELALEQAGFTPGGVAAAGMAKYRNGDLSGAEAHFRNALGMDGKHAAALVGLASIYAKVSRFKTAAGLYESAYQNSPNDPSLIASHANALEGAEHIAFLEKALAIYDPGAEEAQSLRAHIAADRTLGDRKSRVLMSSYQTTIIDLILIQPDPRRPRGVGLRVRLNGNRYVRLMLDTGASGISIDPKTAEKAGLESLEREGRQAKGIGDKAAPIGLQFLAKELQIGDLKFADYPIKAFRGAKDGDIDGLIGSDVFSQFLVTIDFPKRKLKLDPLPEACRVETPIDGGPIPSGFHHVYRAGNHLLIPTVVTEGAPYLFLLDSGASSSLIDTETAKEKTKVYRDELTTVRGIQGAVNRTSRADRVSLQFAGFRQDNSDLISISLQNLSDDVGFRIAGILGMPVLWNMKTTLNYCDGAVHFEYRGP